MAVFAYLARDATGSAVQGEVTALDRAEAARVIRNEGKFVVSVEPKNTSWRKFNAASGAKSTARRGDKLKAVDLIYFTNQIAVMVETGVSLAEALEASEHEGNSPRFAKALETVIERVQSGMEFSAALAEHPRVFSKLYVSLIKASEASGQMAPILRRLADHLENQRAMMKKVKGAVTYPIVMFLFALGVTIFLITYVLPKFSTIYAGREDALPVLTRGLLAFSDFVVGYGLFFLIALVLAAVGGVFYFRTPAGRMNFEHFKLKLPLFGPLFHKTYLARSLRTLGTMIESGVSMLDSVHLTTKVCGSPQYEKMWSDVNDRIERGEQISEALADKDHVPKAILKMIGAGERSGQLGSIMGRVADFTEAELNIALKTLTGMIEPAIIMVLGVVVGGLVLALLLPIFTISKALH